MFLIKAVAWSCATLPPLSSEEKPTSNMISIRDAHLGNAFGLLQDIWAYTVKLVTMNAASTRWEDHDLLSCDFGACCHKFPSPHKAERADHDTVQVCRAMPTFRFKSRPDFKPPSVSPQTSIRRSSPYASHRGYGRLA